MKRENMPFIFLMNTCLLAGALMAACAAPAPSQVLTPPAAQVLELKFSHHLPPTAPTAKALEQWIKRLEAETNGRIKITIFPSESLVKGRDAFPATAAGVCDIAFVNNVYQTTRWGLNNIANLAALPFPPYEKGVQIMDRLREKYPVMLREFEGVKVLYHGMSMPTSLHNTKKTIRVPDDIKGMNIASMGESAKVVQSAGAFPVTIPSGSWYLALEKGLIEGIFAPLNVLKDRGIEVLVKYHLDLSIGQGANTTIMNLTRWNSLPHDIKEKFEELNPWANYLVMRASEQVVKEGWKKCRELGHTIIKPTPEELKLWLACGQPAAEDWIKTNAKKGPTREMFEYAKKLIEETK